MNKQRNEMQMFLALGGAGKTSKSDSLKNDLISQVPEMDRSNGKPPFLLLVHSNWGLPGHQATHWRAVLSAHPLHLGWNGSLQGQDPPDISWMPGTAQLHVAYFCREFRL